MAGFTDGTTSPSDFEAAIDTALRSGAIHRTAAAALIEHAVTEGWVSDETRLRVGLPRAEILTTLHAAHGSDSETETPHSMREPLGVGSVLSSRYRLERELGAGGMGVVYLASDQDVAGETFAIKVLRPEVRELAASLDIMREEVRKTRALAHPNIIGMYSLNLDGETVYILMEYLEGKSLDRLMDEDFSRGMPFARAYSIIHDVCTALAHAHDHGVIHSDLKPSNVFVVNSGKAKLLDFGIARVVRTRPGRYDTAELGALTEAYASCEMLNGVGVDPRDDLYSLGVVIYQLLTGRLPFDSLSALDAQASKLKYEPITALTRKQNSALAAALAFSRDKRTSSVEVLLQGLSPEDHRGFRVALVTIAATVAIAAVVAGFAFLRTTRPDTADTRSERHTPALEQPASAIAAVKTRVADATVPSAISPPPIAAPANPCNQPLSRYTLEQALGAGIDASARAALYDSNSAEARDALTKKQWAIECLRALRAAGLVSADSNRFLDQSTDSP